MNNRNSSAHSLTLRALSILAASSVVIALAGCDSSQAASSQNGTLRLGVMADSVSSYVAQIATDQKIFEKHHLNVKIATYSAGIDTVNAVTVNQEDIGTAADFAILNRLGATTSSDLRIFAATNISKTDTAASEKLYAQGITSPSQLTGKSIVTQKGTVVEYWIAKLLQHYDVDPSSVTLLPVESSQEGVALIQSGKATAIWASGKGAQLASAISGVKAIADLQTIDAPTVSVAVSTQSYLQSHRTDAENYLRSVNDVYTFIAQNPDKAASILQKANNTPKDQALLNLESSTNTVELSKGSISALDGINAWAAKNGFIKNKYDVRSYVDSTALQATFPESVTYK